MAKQWIENHRPKELYHLEAKNNMKKVNVVILFIYINYYNYSKQFKPINVFCTFKEYIYHILKNT